jgi:uncharacterized protein YndB with AHSA1/START domain
MSERTSGNLTLTTPSDREIVVTRVFDAPRRLVFEAHTKPEHIKRWWGPRNTELPVCEIDFRPGGAWRFVSRGPDGREDAFKGEYRVIVVPERIIWTFEWEGMPGHIATDALTFEDMGGNKTRLVASSTFASKEDRDGMLEMGMEEGMAETYDRLDELLVTMS